MIRLRAILISVCTLLPIMPQTVTAETTPQKEMTTTMALYSMSGTFEETREYLISAIEEQGIKISNTSYIARMLERTAADVSHSTKVYRHAQALEFCNATLSHQLAANNPHHIIYCPYIIYIYELEGEKGTIYLSYRKSAAQDRQSNAALTGIEALLEKIIKATLE